MRLFIQYLLVNAVLAAFLNLSIKMVSGYDTGFWGMFIIMNCILIVLSINAQLYKD